MEKNSKKRNLSNLIKILAMNTFLFLLLFHIADFYAMHVNMAYAWVNMENHNKFVNYLKYYSETHLYSILFNKNKASYQILDDRYQEKMDIPHWHIYRPIENKNKDKSILIFGCSFAYGAELLNEETFSYFLGKSLPNYRIYNRSRIDWATTHMLYQLENKDFSEIPDIKYIVYCFIVDHLYRNNNSNQTAYTPYYSKKNYVVKNISLKYLNVPLIKHLQNVGNKNWNSKLYKIDESQKFLYTKKILESSKLKAENKFGPDTKFIILQYDNGKEEPYNWIFEELKEEGFIVVTLKDLSGINYLTQKYQISETDTHPNALAWREITPLFVKYLKDRGYFND